MAINVVQAKCPSCGANLPVPPGIPQITCRYCQNVITVEMRRPPPEVRPFGSAGMIPSRTLYIDPSIRRSGRNLALVIGITCVLPILIPLLIGVGPWAVRSCKGAIKPFPVACGLNEEVEVSGNWEGAEPIVSSVGVNCKIHIRNAKLKGTSLVKTDASNLELFLDNVTIETTDTMVKSGSNLKVKIHGSTLTSATNVFDTDTNLQVLELTGSTVESKGGAAFKSKYNLKLHTDNAKIRAKRNAIDTEANLEVTTKAGTEITSSDAIAIKTTSSFKLEAEGGKIEGPEGAILSTSGTSITAQNLALASSKAKALTTTSSLKLDYTGGSISSLVDAAIEVDSSSDLNLVNVTVQGATAAVMSKSSFKLKATKKTRLVATAGTGILGASNLDLTFLDAGIDASAKALRGTSNIHLRLGQGARLAGKKGGIETEGNLELESTGATIDGGSGPGILAGYNGKIDFEQGALKGLPALVLSGKPSTLDLTGSKVDGEQKVSGR